MKKTGWIRISMVVCIILVVLGFSADTYAAVWTGDTTETEGSDQKTQSGRGGASRNITKNNSSFDVSAELGFDGYFENYKGGHVKITVTSRSNFTGKVSVASLSSFSYSGSSDVSAGIHSKEVSFASGETNVLDYYLESAGEGGITVKIYDEDGEEVYSETDVMPQPSLYSAEIVVGVLSDDVAACSYMSTASITTTAGPAGIRVVDLTMDDLPESEIAYDSLDYILIDSYDTAAITDTQYEAIRNWCMLGGSVILALGSDARKVMNAFDEEFTGVQVGDTLRTDVSFNTSSLDEDGNVLTATYKDVVVAELLGVGAQACHISEGADEYVKKESLGQVIVLPYSLVMAPISQGDAAASVAACVIEGNLSRNVLASISGSSSLPEYYGYDATSTGVGRRRMSPAPIVAALLIYIALSGPVTYVVLKKLKKRELIWIAVPAWAVVGTLTIFVVSLRYRVIEPVSWTFATVDISGDYCMEKTYTSVITSKTGRYNIGLNDSYTSVKFSDSYSDYSYLTDSAYVKFENAPELIDGADGRSISYYNTSPFNSICMSSSKIHTNDIGDFGDGLKLYTDGFEGTVTNNTSYDMTNVFVLSDNKYYAIESLPAGESVDIKRSDNMSYAGFYYYGSMFDEYYERVYGYDVPNEISAQNKYMSAYFDYNKPTGHTGGGLLIWASIDKTENLLSDDDTDSYGSCVVYDMRSADYEDVEGTFYPSIYEAAVTYDDWDSSDLMMYDDEVELQIAFEAEDDIDTLVYEGQRADSLYEVDTYAYNTATGTYELIFTGSKNSQLSGEKLSNYLQGGRLNLRFSTTGDGAQDEAAYNSYLPYISAKGGGK